MKAIAPGKVILSGEHAVVYGRPALAMAIDRSAEAVLTDDGLPEGVSFDLPDLGQAESFTLRALREFRKRALRSYRAFLDGEIGVRDVVKKPVELFQFAFITVLDGLHLKARDGLRIRLHSTIPIGCGLGSSAATIVSVLRAVGHYFRVEFRPDWYLKYSLEAENLQHGHASGVDAYISLHGGCARFREGRAEKLPLPRTPFALVDTGTPSTTTGECVAEVARGFAASRIWDDFEQVTLAMERAFAENDAESVRALLRENHRLLHSIGVVPEPVQAFIRDIEREGGAAKICGAGSVAGAAGGIVLVSSDVLPAALCGRYGYRLLPVRGEPLGARIV